MMRDGKLWLLSLGVLFAATVSACADLAELEARVAAVEPMEPVSVARCLPEELAVIDCEGMPDARKIATMLLQGLANRGMPRLYLRGLHGFNNNADDWWLERLEQEYGIGNRPVTWEEALAEFGSGWGGIVVWDDKLAATENTASMMAGLLGWVACAPADLAAARAATGLEVVADLRGLWTDHLAPQRWALEHVVPRLPRTDIGCICSRAALSTDPRLCRDWLVMRAGAMVDLSSTRETERPLKDEYYKQMLPGSYVWGWVTYDGEVPHVEHATISGHQVLCTTNSPNLSVFSQIQPHQTSWSQPHSAPVVQIERKLYVSFVVSDGDAPPILQTRYWYRWDEEARGKVPVGWELQTDLAIVAPILLEYYYETASPLDRFVAAPPYVLPTKLPDPEWYMSTAATLSARCDLDTVYIGNDPIRKETAELWTQCFPLARGFLYGWGAAPRQAPCFFAGKPHIRYGAVMTPPEGHGDDYYKRVYDEMDAYARRWGFPAVLFVHLSNYNAGPNDVSRMAHRLRDAPVEIVPVDTAMEVAQRLLQADGLKWRPAE